MKLFSANLDNLRDLYTNSLQKTLDMEQQITKTLPSMIEKTTDEELRSGLQAHLEETEGHVQKVEGLLTNLTGEANTATCKVMSALATEGSDMIKDAADPVLRDVSIIAACQQVEHHEIAVYGTLRTWAELLGLEEDEVILESILEEEKTADEILTVASSRINIEAKAA